ncbi:hypothetical protein DFR71_0031 [Nocardia alba]|uniref:Uncharacterized protein n=1 Tax=Nocardia alba TaxID=225051 RepID=A0A4R1FY05_9NOCA|nr:hypothetical protein DFR71_0031 [Nocardia alba]
MPELSVSVGFAERLPAMISHTSTVAATAARTKKLFRRFSTGCYRRRMPRPQPREERAVYEATAQIQRPTAMHRLRPGAVMSGTRLARARFTV